ncbi:MAG: T9SS type A sorting domain-containing protein, partial [Bacteroidetes bacterium]|nr:T9SS type A sorting domain-containing protein [Bacteroidota bacterium]
PDRKRLLIQFNYLHVRPATVDLFEITGKNVFSSPLFTISSGVQVISLDQMPEGIYYLKVLVDETEFSRKIILLK